MAFDQILAEEVRKALREYPMSEKRMFGGIGFMVNRKLCVSVNNRPDHIMMVRIDPKNQDEVLKRKGAKIAVMRGKKMPGWIFLQKEAVETQKDFDFWINQAIDFNKRIANLK
ncbi:MAG TPA: TfoX/Sxy family protein [Candidatus Saccharimonadales bacterium]|nr:TfoX/Sxy family protein [Candidatus Saccharimonadales bacterium]